MKFGVVYGGPRPQSKMPALGLRDLSAEYVKIRKTIVQRIISWLLNYTNDVLNENAITAPKARADGTCDHVATLRRLPTIHCTSGFSLLLDETFANVVYKLRTPYTRS